MVSLSNLNPFKKKENDFSLDEHSLPSLSDVGSSSSGSLPSLDSPSSPSMSPSGSQMDDFSLNSPGEEPISMPDLPPIGTGLGGPQEPQSGVFSQNPITSGLNGQNSDFGSVLPKNNDSNRDSELYKVKLESMDSKVTLIDARLSNIEQKLELLTKLILEEISDETKRKLNVQSMVNNFK